MKIFTNISNVPATSPNVVMPAFGGLTVAPSRRRVEAGVSYVGLTAGVVNPDAVGALGVRAWRPPVT